MPCEPEPLKTRVALVADLFCGAGGSSAGARRALAALGFQMNLVAVNHWNVAIETHSRNHPEARHYCQDVNAVKPAVLVPEGKLDLLMASPTCTYHSRARGGKPINDQGRMDPWAIVHWCTELRVRRLLVENVPEFVDWAHSICAPEGRSNAGAANISAPGQRRCKAPGSSSIGACSMLPISATRRRASGSF